MVEGVIKVLGEKGMEQKIPEITFLTEVGYLSAVRSTLSITFPALQKSTTWWQWVVVVSS